MHIRGRARAGREPGPGTPSNIDSVAARAFLPAQPLFTKMAVPPDFRHSFFAVIGGARYS